MKTYAFHSPKTAGTTIACLNLAIAYQLKNPQTKVGLIHLSRYPDLPVYLNLPPSKQSLHQLRLFIDSPEWSPGLLSTLAQKQIVDCLPSPRGAEWDDFDEHSWSQIYKLFPAQYEVLFVDIGRDIPHFIESQILQDCQAIVTTSCLDPVSLSALSQFLEQHERHKSKQYLLINQAPKEAAALIKQNLKAYEGMILGVLPFDQKRIWDQVYKGFPIIMQKRSAWKKQLLKSLDLLQKL